MNSKDVLKFLVDEVAVWDSPSLTSALTNLYKTYGVKSELLLWDLTVVLEYDSFCEQDWLEAKAAKEKEEVEIDWGEAPDGTTHYSRECDENYECWWKKDGDDFYCILVEGFNTEWVYQVLDDTVQLIQRPYEKWVPQIGEEFEWILDGVSEKWSYGFFVGYDKDGDIVVQKKYGIDGLRTTNSKYSYRFRPLQTQEEIEREEFVETLKSIHYSLADDECFYGELFDRDYRKV